MRNRRVFEAVSMAAIAGTFFVSMASPAWSETVGRTSAVRPNATQSAPGAAAATLRTNDPIMRNASLDTTGSGALEVTFADNSKLSLGPNSNAVIDEFVYQGPGQAGGSQALKYTKGVFRFVSGAMPAQKVKVETPTVTIGIRGTEFRIFVDGVGGSYVAAIQHHVWVTSKLTGKLVELDEGQKVYVGPDGNPGPIENGTGLPCD